MMQLIGAADVESCNRQVFGTKGKHSPTIFPIFYLPLVAIAVKNSTKVAEAWSSVIFRAREDFIPPH